MEEDEGRGNNVKRSLGVWAPAGEEKMRTQKKGENSWRST